jgi:hypothetical protein
MTTIIKRMMDGTYGKAFEEEGGGGGGGGEGGAGGAGGGEGGAGGGEGGSGGNGGLPDKKGAGEGGLPDKKAPPPDPNAPPSTAYNFDLDPKGLNSVDLDGTLLAGKYKNAGELEKAYTNAQSMMGKKSEDLAKELGYFVPEKYDFGDAAKDWDENTTKTVTDKFIQAKLSQAQIAEVVPMIAELGEEFATMKGRLDLMEDWQMTPTVFAAREQEIVTWAQAHLPENVYETYAKMGVEGLRATNALMLAGREGKPWNGEANVDIEDTNAKIREIEAKIADPKTQGAEKKRLGEERMKLFAKLHPATA